MSYSVAKLCLTFCNPIDCSMPGFPVPHYLPEFAQVSDAIQPSHLLWSPSALNLSQHQGLFQWFSSSHQVAEVLELQLQQQSFQWIFRVDFLQNWLVWSPCCPKDSQESFPAPSGLHIELYFNEFQNLGCIYQRYCVHAFSFVSVTSDTQFPFDLKQRLNAIISCLNCVYR